MHTVTIFRFSENRMISNRFNPLVFMTWLGSQASCNGSFGWRLRLRSKPNAPGRHTFPHTSSTLMESLGIEAKVQN